jgi:hypothetical protein
MKEIRGETGSHVFEHAGERLNLLEMRSSPERVYKGARGRERDGRLRGRAARYHGDAELLHGFSKKEMGGALEGEGREAIAGFLGLVLGTSGLTDVAREIVEIVVVVERVQDVSKCL